MDKGIGVEVGHFQQVIRQSQSLDETHVARHQHRLVAGSPFQITLFGILQHHENLRPVVHLGVHTGVRDRADLRRRHLNVRRPKHGQCERITYTLL